MFRMTSAAACMLTTKTKSWAKITINCSGVRHIQSISEWTHRFSNEALGHRTFVNNAYDENGTGKKSTCQLIIINSTPFDFALCGNLCRTRNRGGRWAGLNPCLRTPRMLGLSFSLFSHLSFTPRTRRDPFVLSVFFFFFLEVLMREPLGKIRK